MAEVCVRARGIGDSGRLAALDLRIRRRLIEGAARGGSVIIKAAR